MNTYNTIKKLEIISGLETPSPDDYNFVLDLISDETYAAYFFNSVKNDKWILVLDVYILKCLNDERKLALCYPYIFEVAKFNIPKFVEILDDICTKLNSYAFHQVIKIACSYSPDDAIKIKDSIQIYLKVNTSNSIGGLSEYIDHISKATNGMAFGLDLIKGFVYFRPAEQTQSIDTDANFSQNAGRPLIGSYEYQEFLQDVVRPYAEITPFDTSMLLIDAMKSALEIEFPNENLTNSIIQDYSSIWCVRLNEPGDYEESKASLAHMLTYSCEQVFENKSESITALNDVLVSKPWHFFIRLRQHLYAKYPSDITLPWIRGLILGHKDYENIDINFEFQQMIRNACDAFGNEHLSEDELRIIFDSILSGPSKAEFKEWLGEKFTEESYVKRQKFFQLKQLKPFENVLFGKYLIRFQELLSDETTNVSENDYSPYKSARGGFISKQSPKSADDLADLEDTALLAYINDWQNEHRAPDNWLVEIDISALAGTFKKVFISNILAAPERFAFWMANYSKITRPIYVRNMVNACAEQFQAGKYENIEPALVLCKWVLTHQDSPTEGGDSTFSEESNTNPDWSNTRRAVCDLVDVCLSKDNQAPISAKVDIEALLTSLCTQYDQRLDRDQPIFLNQRDPLSEAINNTRSRALEDLINYGFWLKRYDEISSVSIVFDILEKRLASDAEFKLTIPEHALLGLNFGRLALLDEERAKSIKDYIFPKLEPEVWSAAFGNLLRYNQPYKKLFQLMEEDYKHALEIIKSVPPSETHDRDWTDTLGQHLFSYALWQVFPLTGEASHLQQYYDNTKAHPVRWARLFNHIGRSLKNAGSHIKDELKTRVYQFVSWRLEQTSKDELKDFSSWLGAECLDAEWRLDTFSKVLDISPSKDVAIYTQIEELSKMLGVHTPKVVECFAKLLQGMSNLDFIYIQADNAKPILTAGLKHSDEFVKGLAVQARESLLRAGHFEFME